MKVLQPGGPWLPRVRLLSVGDGQQCVLKDYFHCHPFFRQTVARFVTGNEVRAYQKLAGVKGVPRLFSRPTLDSLVIEYVQGQSVRWMESLPWPAVEQVRQLLHEMHRRGVAHGDLGHDSNGDLGRDTNLIWGDDGQVYIIDFASAVYRGVWSFGLYETFRRHDQLVVTKLLRRFHPEQRGADEYDLLNEFPRWSYWFLRRLKKM